MDPTVTAYRDAAAAFLRGIAGQDAFRALQSGEREANLASWRAFRGFGLDEMLGDAAPDEQVRVIAAVGIEAGRALYTGPIMEGGGVAMHGTDASPGAGSGADVVLAIDPSRPGAWNTDAAAGEGGSIAAEVSAFPYGNLAARLVVPARVAGSPAFVAVDTTDAALVSTHRLQVDGSFMSGLALRARPGQHEVLAKGDAAISALQWHSEWLLLSTSARLIGIAVRVNEIVNEYISVRTQFGKTLASFQALQHRVVDAHIEVELANALLWRMVAEWDNMDQRSALLFALKSHASKTALLAARQGVQLFGGMGFSDEGPIGSYLKHAMVLAARHGNEATARRRFREQAVDPLG